MRVFFIRVFSNSTANKKTTFGKMKRPEADKMKNSFLFILVIIVVQLSCKENVITPPDDKPPGYQDDIPWPSLADSPWPMNNHDPQNTGRGKMSGSLEGIVDWIFLEQNKYINSSLVIDSDSTIYAPFENGGLIAIKPDGTIKWRILEDKTSTPATPILTSTGLIIHSTQAGIYGISKNGTIEWFYPISPITDYALTIGNDGVIYFITNNFLYALNLNGQIEWSYFNSEFAGVSSLSFSPDSKTLYVPGNINTPALIAFDVDKKQIIWRFGRGGTQWSVVDSYGNIYVSAFIDSINNGRGTLFSLKPDGSINWFREHVSWSTIGGVPRSSLAKLTLDKSGNLFFVSDSIFSIDYSGRIRWRKKIEADGFVTSPLVSDENGNIYIVKEKFEHFDLLVFNNQGDLLFEILNLEDYPGQSPIIAFKKLIIPSGNGQKIFAIK